jgi:hypothetical protein
MCKCEPCWHTVIFAAIVVVNAVLGGTALGWSAQRFNDTGGGNNITIFVLLASGVGLIANVLADVITFIMGAINIRRKIVDNSRYVVWNGTNADVYRGIVMVALSISLAIVMWNNGANNNYSDQPTDYWMFAVFMSFWYIVCTIIFVFANFGIMLGGCRDKIDYNGCCGDLNMWLYGRKGYNVVTGQLGDPIGAINGAMNKDNSEVPLPNRNMSLPDI